ncbi:hypothetical protein [Methylobrevis pamukkalensis]|uniref:Uncharacterized protein n=1 Tax=Methylobrevis pamukkalensis TaxID=1439726 RepID=A0A1E3GPV3_9HYPH|nr:hypothetical protein [Methylobrevis pamukkalensis]ODN65975.1 hypothetical protein A6302_04474 [Methylobrevis pamukkalensis]
MTTAQMNGIFAAANAQIAPYGTGDLKIVVSVVNDKNKIVWSQANANASARSAGANGPIAIASGVIPTGTQLIVVEVQYRYEWLVATGWPGFGGDHGYDFDRVFTERPRLGDTITFSS